MNIFELTNVQRDLLFTVDRLDGACGIDIKYALEDSQRRSLLSSQVYPNLDSLVEMGFVEKSSVDGRTNAYTVTDAGRDAIADLYEWQHRYVANEPRNSTSSEG